LLEARSYRRIDAMLREKQATADIRRKSSGEIIAFPGAKIPPAHPSRSRNSLKSKGWSCVSVALTTRSGCICRLPTGSCTHAKCAIARWREDLRNYFTERRSEWVTEASGRSAKGRRKVLSLVIDGWDTLEAAPINETLNCLRRIGGLGWKQIEDRDAEVRRIREGESSSSIPTRWFGG
jgi:hypothetical protein